MNSLVGHLAKSVRVLSQFTWVTTCEIDVYVQDIKNALAYAIHDFLVTVKDYGFTQFRFESSENVKGLIIQFHSLHHLPSSRRWSVLSGIYRFENAGDHRHTVTILDLDTRGVVESSLGRPCRD